MGLRKLKFLYIPENNKPTRVIAIPQFVIWGVVVVLLGCSGLLGYGIVNYTRLSRLGADYEKLVLDNRFMKSEARLLTENLQSVKTALESVHSYAEQVKEMINFDVASVSKRVGSQSFAEKALPQEGFVQEKGDHEATMLPLGVDVEKLKFRALIAEADEVKFKANSEIVRMKELLTSMAQKKSLLAAIPTLQPVKGWISSGFGYRISPFTGKRTMHRGVDIGASVGTPVVAPADGVVIFSGTKSGYGKFIMLAHPGSGFVTKFGHNSQNMAQVGQIVKKGEVIASVGMSGRTTGSHLHYEVMLNGKTINPWKFLIHPHNTLALTN